jgi:hypothetical protein
MPSAEFLPTNRRGDRQDTHGADFFDLANRAPEGTGLPMVVLRQGRAWHDARVNVSPIHGRTMRPDRTCSVSLRPGVRVVAGVEPPAADLALVARRIELHRAARLAYRDEQIATRELLDRRLRV